MLKLAVLALVCAVTLAIDNSLDNEWIAFKAEHQKIYEPIEDNVRRIIWEDNLRFVNKHQAEFKAGRKSYEVGMNAFGDLTNAEFRALYNGYKPELKPESPLKFESTIPVENLPTTVDWRNQGYVTPVKDQKQCGSCWAFSTTGSLEGQHFKRTGNLVSLSEQNLVDCSRKEGNMGCNGGLMDQAFQYIIKNNGIDTEASYPYKARDGRCRFQAASVGATMRSFVDIKRENETDLQAAVATVGPVSVAIDASHMSFQLYKRGVYDERECSETRLDHGVLAVGYGMEGSRAYWLVKNSWNTNWGMEGYIMMSRNNRNQCGIATQASYPLV